MDRDNSNNRNSNSNGGNTDPPDDRDQDGNKLICLDTESSICLAFDRSLYNSLDLGIGQNIHMVPAMGTSSETHFIPHVREVNGSSDSHQNVQRNAEAKLKAINSSCSGISSSNPASMMTADMAYAGDTEDFLHGSSDIELNTDMDLELQAAVDMLLTGESADSDAGAVAEANPPKPSRNRAFLNVNAILGSARVLTGKLFKANGNNFVPIDPQSQQPQQTQHQNPQPVEQPQMQGFEQSRSLNSSVVPLTGDMFEPAAAQRKFPRLRGLLGTRFARNREDSPAYSEGDTSMSSLEKDAAGRKIVGVVPENKTTVRAACCLPEPIASTPSSGPRFLRPLVQFVQKRPVASLGITLSVLLALLAIIIVVLIVCVFPFLMRATLQDVGVILTEVHAVPPSEVSRELLVGRNSEMGAGHRNHGRMAVEMHHLGIPYVRGSGHVAPKENWAREMQSAAISSPLALSSAVEHNGVSFHTAPARSTATRNGHHRSNQLRHETMENIASASHSPASVFVAQAMRRATTVEDVVTLTNVAMSTVHIPPPPLERSVASVHPTQSFSLATPSNTHSGAATVRDAGSADAVKDAKLTSSTYMMQLAGNLTSGGPIGVSIEFTEPLRLLWRDVEVGVINNPEKIYISGRGTTQFTWPPFEVAVPGALSRRDEVAASHRGLGRPLTHAAMHASAASDAGFAAVAQRRTMDGNVPLLGRSTDAMRYGDIDDSGYVREGMTNWFAAIQAHLPFTMQWRSRVKLSALGLHTKDILFDKTVNIICGEARNCTIDGSAFAT
ncbi:hypothetical protein GGI15_004674 [Coemansia interrupta]|uniref:Transmembrane protein n=1 Tax=Coemansia interrupta TaxID=1126814 RepID=A0A9W8H8N3_9FUNG|nr:hypothetical protein GGI15_004674 [Coemansia interrupta]